MFFLLYNLYMKLFTAKEMKKVHKELIFINEKEKQYSEMTNEEIQNQTNILKERLKKGETLKNIRPDAFAIAREAIQRVHKKRLFDVQIMGGLVLDHGSVAEMKTGEGKTLTSIPPIYLNALLGKGVIVSTVNEYLTERDSIETGAVFNFLNISVGTNKTESSQEEKREAYASDVTYSVHSEIGFDYLRDNMVKKIELKVQRPFNYALIDEVDSILIDEARTPLIITGGASTLSKIYEVVDKFVKTLKDKDYDIDHESKSIQLNESGMQKASNFFGVKNIFEIEHSEKVHRIQNSLRANYIMFNDSDYIVVEGKILIVDSFTGRVMEGRSFSDGLQQSIQAKENVEIESETKTMATITYQNLFRMFPKLAGMTGTAKTEEDEFIEIYNMRVHSIPTNKPIVRIDKPDKVFASIKAKYKSIVKDVKKKYTKGQPILLGTEEVSESEVIAKLLKKENIKFQLLNAKQNLQEAEIIEKAGIENSVTIATNMAGRGTDIKLTEKSKELGGLYVIGTNRSESRRIDNQLIGRSGRQGDVGESRFYLSIEDKLISRFSNQPKLKKAFKSYEDEEINSKSVRKAMKNAQIKIEGFNFDSRKDVLQYDNVIRQQRDLIYSQRDIIISHDDLEIIIKRMMSSVVKDITNKNDFESLKNNDGTINIKNTCTTLNTVWFRLTGPKLKEDMIKGKTREEIIVIIEEKLLEAYKELKENTIENTSVETMHDLEREIILETFDQNWQVHIDKMSKLKTSSSMASYAQKNPYQVYVEKGAENFEELLKRISHNTIRLITSNEYGVKNKEDFDIPNELLELMNKEVKTIQSKEDKVKKSATNKPKPKENKVKKPAINKPKPKEDKVKKPAINKPKPKEDKVKKPAINKPKENKIKKTTTNK